MPRGRLTYSCTMAKCKHSNHGAKLTLPAQKSNQEASAEFKGKKKKGIVNQKITLILEMYLQLETLLMGYAREQCSQLRCPNPA